MPQTRAATGNSKPRVFATIDDTTTSAPRKSAKANTSKPRAKTVAGGRVEKKKGALKSTKDKAEPKVVKKTPAKKATDKVVGKAEKGVGKVEGSAAKKAAGDKKAKSTTTTTKKASTTATAKSKKA